MYPNKTKVMILYYSYLVSCQGMPLDCGTISSCTATRYYFLFLFISIISNTDPKAELDFSNLSFSERKKNKWVHRCPARILSGYHIQNEDESLFVATIIIFLKKTFAFSFSRSIFMLPGFVAVFYQDAINPGLCNNNADGSVMYKVLYKVPRWKDPPRRKAAVSSLITPGTSEIRISLTHSLLLITPGMSGIRISHTYVPTCQQVSLCVNMGFTGSGSSSAVNSLDNLE